jgi:hypothetical protein
MHMAHLQNAKLLTVEEIAKLAGVKRRQVANLARRGEVPGARRASNGYHFEYPDSPALRLWIKRKRRLAKERQQLFAAPRWYYPKGDVDMKLPRKLAGAFSEWKFWMRENQPFHRWEDEKLRALEWELGTFNEAYETVKKLLKQRSNQRVRERALALTR